MLTVKLSTVPLLFQPFRTFHPPCWLLKMAAVSIKFCANKGVRCHHTTPVENEDCLQLHLTPL